MSSIETSEGKSINETLVKSLTGGDKIRARRLYENYWEFAPTHKLVLATNHKPRIKSGSHAIWRRIVLIPFSAKFWERGVDAAGPDELEADKSLGGQLLVELPGILAWAVRGCLAWQEHGLQRPAEVLAATEEYRSEEDVIGEFLAERTSRGGQVASGELYRAYIAWAEDQGDYPISHRRFSDLILQKDWIEKKKSMGNFFTGLDLLREFKKQNPVDDWTR